jgi:competence ComEA-like helix-hairpin-helix protein
LFCSPSGGSPALPCGMPPRPLLVLLALAVAGHGVRLALLGPGDAAGAVQILSRRPLGAPSAAAHRDSIAALSRPLAAGERINLDRASVPEIARLPRVGIALAKRIAADRAARGPFGSLAGLDRVPGVGPGLLRTLEPHAAFDARPALPLQVGTPPAGPTAPQCSGAQSLTGNAEGVGCALERLPLNTATVAQLDSLPGIGPARAAAIVRYREERGPFRSAAELSRVPGINPALLQRLYDRLQVP